MQMQTQTHDFTATLQFGIVSAIDAASHSLRVKIPVLDDMETDWLPMATPAAGGNRFYSLPDVGELRYRRDLQYRRQAAGVRPKQMGQTVYQWHGHLARPPQRRGGR